MKKTLIAISLLASSLLLTACTDHGMYAGSYHSDNNYNDMTGYNRDYQSHRNNPQAYSSSQTAPNAHPNNPPPPQGGYSTSFSGGGY